MVLHDAQTRLFFKAQAVIQSEIGYYVLPSFLLFPVQLLWCAAFQAVKHQVPMMHLEFLEALRRDLRSGVARVRLYLKDDQSVRVFREYGVEHVSRAYEWWDEVMMPVQGTSTGGWLPPEAALELTARRPASRSASQASEPRDLLHTCLWIVPGQQTIPGESLLQST